MMQTHAFEMIRIHKHTVNWGYANAHTNRKPFTRHTQQAFRNVSPKYHPLKLVSTVTTMQWRPDATYAAVTSYAS